MFGEDPLEQRLRGLRPEPGSEFVASLSERLAEKRPRVFRGTRGLLAGGLTAALLVALAITGGLSYAAQSTSNGASAAASVASSSNANTNNGNSSSNSAYKNCKPGDEQFTDAGTGKVHCRHACNNNDAVVPGQPGDNRQHCRRPDGSTYTIADYDPS